MHTASSAKMQPDEDFPLGYDPGMEEDRVAKLEAEIISLRKEVQNLERTLEATTRLAIGGASGATRVLQEMRGLVAGAGLDTKNFDELLTAIRNGFDHLLDVAGFDPQ